MKLAAAIVWSASFAVARLAAAGPTVWQMTGRAPVTGELTAVYGSVALLTAGSQDFFVPLERLDDTGLKRVADFLAAKPAVGPTWGSSRAEVTRALRAHLEILRDGHLRPYDPSPLPEPEIYLIYFSAHWCPPCQRFTPELVKAYHRLQEMIPQKFELIFVSDDRSPDEQEEYARETGMPWPVLKYSYVGRVTPVERWAGDGIPCLVALTPKGELILHTYNGKEYLGPEQVVSAFEALVPMLKGTSPEIIRARHRLSVLQHVAAVGNGSSPPKPYLVSLDPSHYQGLELNQLLVTLNIDETGRVTDAESEPKLSVAFEDQFNRDTSDWLFLPAIEHGRPIAQTVRMPLQFNHKG